MPDRLREIAEEIQQVVIKGRGVMDIALPPLLFVILLRWFGFTYAVGGALALAFCFVPLRFWQGRLRLAALGGAAGVLLAAGIAQLWQQETGFFVSGMATGALTVLLALVSVAVKRPLTAWSSHFARRWPRDWYWHPQVRPAYTETTWLWAIYFGGRLLLQLFYYREDQVAGLAGVNFILGWPGILLLLVVTYLYGLWRLRHLAGPSVVEFEQNAPPPWRASGAASNK
jgi:hypothetical protein